MLSKSIYLDRACFYKKFGSSLNQFGSIFQKLFWFEIWKNIEKEKVKVEKKKREEEAASQSSPSGPFPFLSRAAQLTLSEPFSSVLSFSRWQVGPPC